MFSICNVLVDVSMWNFSVGERLVLGIEVMGFIGSGGFLIDLWDFIDEFEFVLVSGIIWRGI